ncbi:serine/threonine protein kinase [Halobacillus sp. BBL2006]|uniref:serine/threonine protein kinase n=1 Tax=Halobacillus sp. BBL2006 TaxID=1543706 RepID=UPI000541A202|nr:serine/threonine protein kinase [Halobacillus sp. BBL2006]KHE67679.1 serine/threonine protein kinase [Halobacillus sp. BBL2006]
MKTIKEWVTHIDFNGDCLVDSPKQLQWIGQGRSAVVFKVEDTNHAVKVFYPRFQALAEKEAEVYRKLSNHDFFPRLIMEGEGFLVLEYVEGITFYDCLVQGIAITPDMVLKVDEALDFARKKGLNPSDIHLKNMMLTKENEVKIIDVVRFTQQQECSHWPDLKKAYYTYYQRRFFPKKYPRVVIEFIIRLYRKRLLPI